MTARMRLTGTNFKTDTIPAALLDPGRTVALALPDGTDATNLRDALEEGRVLIEHERTAHPDRFYLDRFDVTVRWAATIGDVADHGTHVDITATIHIPHHNGTIERHPYDEVGTDPTTRTWTYKRTFTVLPHTEVDVVISPALRGL